VVSCGITVSSNMQENTVRSIITCDLEGRIETFNDGAERLFGYAADEVIGKKRVSVFSPGEIVLGHVGDWLAAAKNDGEYRTNTVFLKKSGTPFAAEIRITPTYKKLNGEKQHIGYCGMTKALPDVPVEEAMPRIGWATRLMSWMVVTRAPFLTATLMPVMIASAWALSQTGAGAFPWGFFVSAMLGALCLQVSANTFNDYFDWQSGADPTNVDYFVPYTGGSRSIELGLITDRALLRLAVMTLLLGAIAALPVLLVRSPGILAFGATGAALAYFYTAPPLRLSARRGLGELSILLAFGPLLTAGTYYAVTGIADAGAYLIGLPIGLLALAILWVNQFPDMESDAMTGKNHLLVTVGKRAARWVYVLILAMAFMSTIVLTLSGILPLGSLAVLLALPLAAYATRIVFRHYLDRELVRASKATIQLHLVCGFLLVAGIIWSAN
jgi:1,4-dihydroxy-2-naphthoate octaprenyltransferase